MLTLLSALDRGQQYLSLWAIVMGASRRKTGMALQLKYISPLRSPRRLNSGTALWKKAGKHQWKSIRESKTYHHDTKLWNIPVSYVRELYKDKLIISEWSWCHLSFQVHSSQELTCRIQSLVTSLVLFVSLERLFLFQCLHLNDVVQDRHQHYSYKMPLMPTSAQNPWFYWHNFISVFATRYFS